MFAIDVDATGQEAAQKVLLHTIKKWTFTRHKTEFI